MSLRGSLYVFLGNLADRLEPRYYHRLDGYLRSARMGVTYRAYMARTYLYALLVGLVVLVASTAFVAVFADRLVREAWIAPPLAALGFGYAVHTARVYYPRYVADVRADRIDATLPGVTSFTFALVRGGVPLAEVLDTVSSHPDVFGEAAEELGVAARDVDRFGGDVVTALRRLAEETPSEDMSEFLKSFVSVVIRKEDVSGFLGEKAREFHDDAEERQETVLERLEVLAEFYVVVFVAAPLFVITILVVVGFVGSATLVTLRAFIYLIMPVAGFGFVILLDVLFEPPSKPEDEEMEDEYPVIADVPDSETTVEGAEENDEALDRYEKRERLIEYLSRPMKTLRKNPGVSLRLAVGLGFIYLILKAAVFLYIDGTLPTFEQEPSIGLAFTETTENIVASVDDTLVEATMISLFVYAVLYQTRAEYLRSVEERLPELLGRLSSINQAGVPFLQSLVSLREVDLGVLNEQVKKLGRDIRLNSTATDALKRFENRAGSPAVTRTTVLLNNTSEASGRLGRVLEIAERDAKLRDRLARHRRDQMSLYTVVIYVSFAVFIVIIAVLSTVFIPAVPTGEAASDVPQLQGDFDPMAYSTLFYHATVVQAVLSGFIAGKMTSGRISTGAKHAFVMVAVAYLTFNFFLLLV
ncbi:MAG: type II secretion system F family protein [Halobacteriales archaeon]